MRKLQKPSREVGDIAAPVQLAHFAIDHLKQNNLQFEVGPVKRLLPRVLCFALCFFLFFSVKSWRFLTKSREWALLSVVNH